MYEDKKHVSKTDNIKKNYSEMKCYADIFSWYDWVLFSRNVAAWINVRKVKRSYKLLFNSQDLGKSKGTLKLKHRLTKWKSSNSVSWLTVSR